MHASGSVINSVDRSVSTLYLSGLGEIFELIFATLRPAWPFFGLNACWCLSTSWWLYGCLSTRWWLDDCLRARLSLYEVLEVMMMELLLVVLVLVMVMTLLLVWLCFHSFLLNAQVSIHEVPLQFPEVH